MACQEAKYGDATSRGEYEFVGCAISLTHWWVQKLEAYPPTIAPASPSVENQVTKPKANNVSWSVHVLQSLTSMCIQKLSENSTTAVSTTKDYAMATVKEVLTLSHSAAGVMPVPFLREAIGVALKIIQVCEVRFIPPLNVARQLINFFIRRHRLLNKRSKSCKLGWVMSWSLSWTTSRPRTKNL